MRLSVRQGDKDLLCNQQTIARKYQFSSPVESLEGKFSRQCWVCNWEDKSCLYLTAHEKIAEQGWDAFSSVWGGTGAKLPDHRGPTEHPIHMNGFFKDTVKRGKWALEGVGKGHVPSRRRDRLVGAWRREPVRLVESARVNSFSHKERFWGFLRRMQSSRGWHSETMSFLPQLRKRS